MSNTPFHPYMPPQSDRIFLTAENPVQLDFIALIIMVKLSITLRTGSRNLDQSSKKAIN